MADKDRGSGLGLDLGLSLSAQNHPRTHDPSLKLNLMPSFPSFFTPDKPTPSFNDLFHSSSDRGNTTMPFHHRGLDINSAPQVIDCDDDTGVSSPNSTISSLSGKRGDRDLVIGEDAEAERTSCSRGGSDDDDLGAGADGDASRKKLRLSKEQSLLLEETFKEHNTLNPKQKTALAKELNLTARQVEVWFQNRRARTKLKQNEVDCEYLKRCCENLTQENRRLQKEVQELRALKLSPHLYMHMNPPTTLTMCPSCERVAVSSSSSSSSVAAASNRNPVNPQPQRPVPIKPWGGLPMEHQRS